MLVTLDANSRCDHFFGQSHLQLAFYYLLDYLHGFLFCVVAFAESLLPTSDGGTNPCLALTAPQMCECGSGSEKVAHNKHLLSPWVLKEHSGQKELGLGASRLCASVLSCGSLLVVC